MIATHLHFLLTAALVAILPSTGLAQTLPADCSAATAPTQPVAISVGGVKFTPRSIKLRSAGGVKTGDEEFDTYQLSLRSEDDLSPPLEADVTVMVLKGQRIDGRVFRRLPTKDRDRQPSASQRQHELEVQGWSFKNRPAKTDFSHAEHIGSLRLEFGQRKGAVISGSIYLCVAKGQTTMFNKTPTKEESYAVGTFQARVE